MANKMKALGSRAQGARLERMRASPRWSGSGFRNMHPVLPGLRDPFSQAPTLADFLRDVRRGVPAQPLPSMDPLPAWRSAPQSGLRCTWLGHSTVLIEIGGVRILTDPVWGRRASPSALAGPKRFQPVPVPVRRLPPLDAVVISHDHYDHLDYPTIHELKKTAVPFITSLGVGAHLEGWGVPAARIVELDWWEHHRLPGSEVEIHAAPAQHFSGRGLADRNATLWSSMVMISPHHRVFFSGDTGLTTEYEVIRDRLGPFDLVMLEIGAHHPAWGDIHLGPDNALRAHGFLGGGVLLPIHWGTFRLAMHAWDQPVETLLARARKEGTPLLLPRIGEALEPDRADNRMSPWWREVGAATISPRTPDRPLPEGMQWPPD